MLQNRHAPPPKRAPGWPEGEDDMINKFGTYNVQATCDTENLYPMIAQGLAKGESRIPQPGEIEAP